MMDTRHAGGRRIDTRGDTTRHHTTRVTMTGRATTTLLAIAALIAGIVLLLVPVHGNLGAVDLACGSALHEDYSAAVSENTDISGEIIAYGNALSGQGSLANSLAYADSSLGASATATRIAAQCDSSVTTRRAWSWSIVALGVILLVAVIARRPERSTT